MLEADANTLKMLAPAIVARGGLVAVLVSTSRPALVVVAARADVAPRSNEILAQLIARFGGKGGGKPDLAQGGGLDADQWPILERRAESWPSNLLTLTFDLHLLQSCNSAILQFEGST